MTTSAPSAPPAGRYGPVRDAGTRRRTARVLWVLGAVGLAVAVWLGVRVASTPVTWEDVGFTLDGTQGVDVVYDVSRADPSVAVQCRLQALSHQFAEVGARVVDVPAATSRTVRVTSTVATSQAAVTGVVDRCWVP